MAHELNFVNGQAACVVVGAPAWHNLGSVVSKALTWKEALKLGRIGWGVQKIPMIDPLTKKSSADVFGLYRDDNDAYLGYCGSDYRPISNTEHLAFLDKLAETNGDAYFETAGALGAGERVWGLMKLPTETRIKGTDDVSKHYLLGVAFHNGRRANQYRLTTVRVVCNNTLTMALARQTDDELRICHTDSGRTIMADSDRILKSLNGDIKTLNDKLNFLNEKKLTTVQFAELIRQVFPEIETSAVQQNVARDILVRYERNDGDRFKNERGTALNLFNAVTEYVDHGKAAERIEMMMTKGADGQAKAREAIQRRATGALFGAGAALKTAVLDEILKLVKYAPAAGTKTNTRGVDNILAKVAA